MSEDSDLGTLARRGHKVVCPGCGKSYMSEAYRPFIGSGIGQHIRHAHPELEPLVIEASKARERAIATLKRETEREARARPLRKHVFTGAEVDEIIDELRGLIETMEPYYAQCNAGNSAQDLIEKLEARALLTQEPVRKEGVR